MRANAEALVAEQEEEEEPQMVAMLDVLQTLGVEPEIAVGFASSVARNRPRFEKLREQLDHRKRLVASLTGKAPTFFEVYGQGRILESSHGCRRNQHTRGCMPWTCEQTRMTALHGFLISNQTGAWQSRWFSTCSPRG